MNDRHPSGSATTPAPASDDASAPYAPYGVQDATYGDFTTYGDHSATGFHTGAPHTTSFAADPLFGDLSADATHTTGAYDTTQWATDGHETPAYDPYAAQHHAAYDTGAHDTAAWATGYQRLAAVPQQPAPAEATGQWDTTAWLQPGQADTADQTQQWDWGTQTFDTTVFDTGAFDTRAFDTGAFDTTDFDTGAYDATQWNNGAPVGDSPAAPGAFPDATGDSGGADDTGHDHPADSEFIPDATSPSAPVLLDDQEEVTPAAPAPASRAASRGAGRSRRRPPAKRSALLTVAVPSVCVMGVAGIAAGSVGAFSDDGKDATASAANVHPVQPATANNQLDTQLQSLSAGADDFADRASRTQERIDLRAQKEAEKRKAAEEAARRERLRPKFVLPVTQRGLSAYFGQAGVNWMSVHTGIDFPVSYGTTVMAATDGTVRTQWNSAYGNMMIVTAKDGTETWYCHLSSYRVPSGTTVKAGQPIAYSGNSGNSTGPHLHFEVRPAGGAPIDPLPWLRSHGLDPT
ncbi:M23 family metallopeptidase [Streptomyces mexicanus]|uniref:M23 family metallopeptidase n=1 Tax=Streptomyces mexicanus TaxID=178566 RepID=UPI0031E5B1BA